jgi:hypothetical protein
MRSGHSSYGIFGVGYVETRLSLFGDGKQETKRDRGFGRAGAAFNKKDVPRTEAAAQKDVQPWHAELRFRAAAVLGSQTGLARKRRAIADIYAPYAPYSGHGIPLSRT